MNLTRAQAADMRQSRHLQGNPFPLKSGKYAAGEQTPTQEPAPEPEEEKVHLGLDTVHVYEKMNTSFAQGYLPGIEGDTVHLTVPFTSSGELKECADQCFSGFWGTGAVCLCQLPETGGKTGIYF